MSATTLKLAEPKVSLLDSLLHLTRDAIDLTMSEKIARVIEIGGEKWAYGQLLQDFELKAEHGPPEDYRACLALLESLQERA
jgi:hypothetical protein